GGKCKSEHVEVKRIERPTQTSGDQGVALGGAVGDRAAGGCHTLGVVSSLAKVGEEYRIGLWTPRTGPLELRLHEKAAPLTAGQVIPDQHQLHSRSQDCS